MDKAQLEFFTRMLNEQLNELLYCAGATIGELLQDADGMPDTLDRAGFDCDRSALLRIRDRESKLIRKIRTALKDIEEGEYGICEYCGKEIPIARLMARPVTRSCIRRKTSMELKEKAVGW